MNYIQILFIALITTLYSYSVLFFVIKAFDVPARTKKHTIIAHAYLFTAVFLVVAPFVFNRMTGMLWG